MTETILTAELNRFVADSKHGICRFHQTDIIRGYFRSVSIISALMFRKDRKQECFNVRPMLRSYYWNTICTLCLLQTAQEITKIFITFKFVLNLEGLTLNLFLTCKYA